MTPEHTEARELSGLTQAQVETFWRDGFLVVPRFIDHQTLERLRELYDRFVAGEIEAGDDDGLLGGVTRQIMHPARYHEYFANNPAVKSGMATAAQLAAGRPEFTFDMLITKPPQHMVETPWHQDHAYFEMPFADAGAETDRWRFQFWVALDDVSPDNGCMQFIPGMHGKLLEHHVASGDPGRSNRLLAITNPGQALDMSKAVACALTAGGCTIHTMGTPHYTGPNVTEDHPRRAYIFNVRVVPS